MQPPPPPTSLPTGRTRRGSSETDKQESQASTAQFPHKPSIYQRAKRTFRAHVASILTALDTVTNSSQAGRLPGKVSTETIQGEEKAAGTETLKHAMGRFYKGEYTCIELIP
jgi:hypothetical protein